MNTEEEVFTLNFVLANSIGNIYWKDREGRYIGCNKKFAKISGLSSPQEIVGINDKDLFAEQLGEAGVEKLIVIDKLVIESGQEITVEETGINEEGQLAYYLSKKMPLRNKQGLIIGIIGTSIDITEQKNAEEYKNEFMKNAMHDIRTPFCGVYGMTELLWLQETDLEKKENLKCILESAKKLLDYSNEILDFQNYKANHLNNQTTCFDYKKIVADVIEMNAPATRIKNIELNAEFPVNDHVLIGDANGLKKILVNLVANAVKFIEKGQINVIVLLEVDKNRKQAMMELVVQDSGIGIPKDKQQIIFEKFVRLNPSYQGIYSGTGLGLTMVKDIIHNMRGTIEVDSDLGSGARFICRLPFDLVN